MKKIICDICGEEITSKNQLLKKFIRKSRVKGTSGNHDLGVTVEILYDLDGTYNKGDVCKYCVLDVVKKIDDRPVRVARPE